MLDSGAVFDLGSIDCSCYGVGLDSLFLLWRGPHFWKTTRSYVHSPHLLTGSSDGRDARAAELTGCGRWHIVDVNVSVRMCAKSQCACVRWKQTVGFASWLPLEWLPLDICYSALLHLPPFHMQSLHQATHPNYLVVSLTLQAQKQTPVLLTISIN